jgi:hypothetical protein
VKSAVAPSESEREKWSGRGSRAGSHRGLTGEVQAGRVARRDDRSNDSCAWPERWPVLGPLAGAALGLCGAGTAIVEGDWIATMVFTVPEAVLGAVARRNRKVARVERHPGVVRPSSASPTGRADPDR